MIGYVDMTRNQNKIVSSFRGKYLDSPPMSQGTVRMLENPCRKNRHERKPRNYQWNQLFEDVELNKILSVEENRNIITISMSSVVRILKTEKFHRYKLLILEELTKDDSDRCLQFFEQIIGLKHERAIHTRYSVF